MSAGDSPEQILKAANWGFDYKADERPAEESTRGLPMASISRTCLTALWEQEKVVELASREHYHPLRSHCDGV